MTRPAVQKPLHTIIFELVVDTVHERVFPWIFSFVNGSHSHSRCHRLEFINDILKLVLLRNPKPLEVRCRPWLSASAPHLLEHP